MTSLFSFQRNVVKRDLENFIIYWVPKWLYQVFRWPKIGESRKSCKVSAGSVGEKGMEAPIAINSTQNVHTLQLLWSNALFPPRSATFWLPAIILFLGQTRELGLPNCKMRGKTQQLGLKTCKAERKGCDSWSNLRAFGISVLTASISAFCHHALVFPHTQPFIWNYFSKNQ